MNNIKERIPDIFDISANKKAQINGLVSHIQNGNLSFFDEAAAIERLLSHYGLTQEDAAALLGRAQSTIANKLRLLRLTEPERELIIENFLTERHARALLRLASADERMIILDTVIKNGLNVDKTEHLIDDYINCERENSGTLSHSRIIQNIRAFLNTLNKAIERMQNSGIHAESRKIQSDDYIEYRIRIPFSKK